MRQPEPSALMAAVQCRRRALTFQCSKRHELRSALQATDAPGRGSAKIIQSLARQAGCPRLAMDSRSSRAASARLVRRSSPLIPRLPQ